MTDTAVAQRSIKADRTVYVDAVNGTTGGVRARLDKPFSTWDGAKAVHTRGDKVLFQPGIHLAKHVAKSHSASISGCVRANNIVTFSTSEAHGFAADDRVRPYNTATATLNFDGEYYIASVPTPFSFTVRQYGVNESVGAGGKALGLCYVEAHGAAVYWNQNADYPELIGDGTGDGEGGTAPVWLVVRGGTWIMSSLGGGAPGQAMSFADESYFDVDVDTLRTDDASETGTIDGNATADLKFKELICDGVYGFVALGGRKLALTGTRIVSRNNSAALAIQNGLPVCHANILEIVGGIDVSGGSDGYEMTVSALTVTGQGSSNRGGGLDIAGDRNTRIDVKGRIAASSGPAIRVSAAGGYRQVTCPYIKSTYANAAGVAIDLSSVTSGDEVLTLGPSVLVASESASVGIKGPASGSVTLRLLGNVRSNKPLGANITLVGGTYTEDSAIS